MFTSYKERWEKSEKILEKEREKEKELPFEKQIQLDSARTFLEHYYFENESSEGRKRLIKMLNVFCVYRKDLGIIYSLFSTFFYFFIFLFNFYLFDPGYCQGMNEIAASILLVMDNDVQAFTVFSEIIDKLNG